MVRSPVSSSQQTREGNIPLHPSSMRHSHHYWIFSNVNARPCLCAVQIAGGEGYLQMLKTRLYRNKVAHCRAVMLSTLHAVHQICSQTLIYIHIYTSLVKICTLHITVHTSHQLLANTRTLMKPKMTALKQAGGPSFPLQGSFFGLHIPTRHCFPEGQAKTVDQVPEMGLQLFFSSNSC